MVFHDGGYLIWYHNVQVRCISSVSILDHGGSAKNAIVHVSKSGMDCIEALRPNPGSHVPVRPLEVFRNCGLREHSPFAIELDRSAAEAQPILDELVLRVHNP